MECIGQVRKSPHNVSLSRGYGSSSSQKKSPGLLTSKTPGIVRHFMKTFTLDLPQEDAGEFVRLNCYKSDCGREEEEGLATTITQLFTDQIPICKSPKSNVNQPLFSSAEPSWRGREFSRAQVCLLEVFKQGVLLRPVGRTGSKADERAV